MVISLARSPDEYINKPSTNRRIKMKKLALSVCVFGLLLSSALAQDKSPERLREEEVKATMWTHDGIHQEKYTKVVVAGTKQRIGFFHFLNPDCSARSDINIRVTKEPEHGAIDTASVTDFAHYRKDNLRYKCNQQRVRGTEVKYKPAEKYVGSDEVELTVIFGEGFAWEVHYDIKVR
jgi:hypothetical protein